ncbi:MAG: glycosyltransferase family 2 protein [Calditrichaeota bacterium]|nr:MAG: glycosyltransferase family 2 protein [Calditrichota bacterium]
MNNQKVVVIIPALNEEKSIGKVITALPENTCEQVIVVDNGSTDNTVSVATDSGATVVFEPQRGYGQACLTGISTARDFDPDIVVFLDGDYSDFPEQIGEVIQPILAGQADMVIGSRTRGRHAPGALLPQARFGNWLASWLIKIFWKFQYSDLGPFRAIRWDSLLALNMQDRNYGWTVEMQIKALLIGLRVKEVPVNYRKRIGTSKVTGTISGSIRAGYKILWVIFKYGFFSKKLTIQPINQ